MYPNMDSTEMNQTVVEGMTYATFRDRRAVFQKNEKNKEFVKPSYVIPMKSPRSVAISSPIMQNDFKEEKTFVFEIPQPIVIETPVAIEVPTIVMESKASVRALELLNMSCDANDDDKSPTVKAIDSVYSSPARSIDSSATNSDSESSPVSVIGSDRSSDISSEHEHVDSISISKSKLKTKSKSKKGGGVFSASYRKFFSSNKSVTKETEIVAPSIDSPNAMDEFIHNDNFNICKHLAMITSYVPNVSPEEKRDLNTASYKSALLAEEILPPFPGLKLVGASHPNHDTDALHLSTWCLFKEQEYKGKSNVYLAFRGSATHDDWVADLACIPSRVSSTVYIHGGYKGIVEMELEFIIACIEKCIDEDEVVTIYPTGHSLGAGLAQTFAILYKQKYMNDSRHRIERVYTFACPLILYDYGYNTREVGQKYVRDMSDPLLNIDMYNFANEFDLVTRMPTVLTDTKLFKTLMYVGSKITKYTTKIPIMSLQRFVEKLCESMLEANKNVQDLHTNVMNVSIIKRYVAYGKTVLFNGVNTAIQHDEFAIFFTDQQIHELRNFVPSDITDTHVEGLKKNMNLPILHFNHKHSHASKAHERSRAGSHA